MPEAMAAARRGDQPVLPVDDHVAAREGLVAEDGAAERALAGAFEPGDADDLAGAQIKSDVGEHGVAAALHRQDGGAELRRVTWRREEISEVAPDHQPDDHGWCQRRGRMRRDQPAVLQHGDAVGDRLQLGHAMGDVEDRRALAPERPDQFEQLSGIALVERRGRLVHDDDLRIERQRLGDLDQLLLGDRQRFHQRLGMDPGADTLEQLARALLHNGAVEQAAAARLKAEEDVVGDAALRQQAELLVEDADPGPARLDRMSEGNGLPAEQDFALVGAIDAAEHLHQRRLAGTVLAADGVDLAGLAIQADIVERPARRLKLLPMPRIDRTGVAALMSRPPAPSRAG